MLKKIKSTIVFGMGFASLGLAGFVVSPLLAKFLNVTEFNRVIITSNYVSVFSVVVLMSMQEPLRVLVIKESFSSLAVLTSIFKLLCLSISASALALYIISCVLNKITAIESILILTTAASSAFATLVYVALQSDSKPNAFVVLTLGFSLLNVITVLALENFSLLTYESRFVSLTILNATVGAIGFRFISRSREKKQATPSSFKILSISIPLLGIALPQGLYMGLAAITAPRFTADENLYEFYVYLQMAMPLTLLASTLNMASKKEMFQMIKEERFRELTLFELLNFSIFFAASLAWIVFLYFFIDALFEGVGENFSWMMLILTSRMLDFLVQLRSKKFSYYMKAKQLSMARVPLLIAGCLIISYGNISGINELLFIYIGISFLSLLAILYLRKLA